MPCFSGDDTGRLTFRYGVRGIAFAFLPLTLTLALGAANGDAPEGYVYVAPGEVFVPAVSIVWFTWICTLCAVVREVDVSDNMKSVLAGLLIWTTWTGIASSVAGYAQGTAAVRLVGVYIFIGVSMLAILAFCASDEASGNMKINMCCLLLAGVTWIVTIVFVPVKLDGAAPEWSWGIVWLPSFIGDFFLAILLLGSLFRLGYRRQGIDNSDWVMLFAINVSMTIVWLGTLMSRILHVIREGQSHTYYALTPNGFDKRVDYSDTHSATATVSPILAAHALLILLGYFSEPVAKCVDAHGERASNIARERREEVNRMNQVMAGVKRTENAAGAKNSGSKDDEAVSVTVDASGVGVTEVEVEVEVKELTPEQEYAAALERVTVSTTEAELAAALDMIAEMLEDPESVHRTNPKNKTELIRLAKNKQAQNKDVWTPKVAAAFRKCLVCFSRGPQLGATMMSGVRNMRNQLRSITGGSSS